MCDACMEIQAEVHDDELRKAIDAERAAADRELANVKNQLAVANDALDKTRARLAQAYAECDRLRNQIARPRPTYPANPFGY